jgi:hypothetical protein
LAGLDTNGTMRAAGAGAADESRKHRFALERRVFKDPLGEGLGLG